MNRKIRRGNQISWREYVLNRSGTGIGGIRNFQNKLSGLAEIGVRGFRSGLMNASRHNAMTLHYEGRFLLGLAASNQGLPHDIFGLVAQDFGLISVFWGLEQRYGLHAS